MYCAPDYGQLIHYFSPSSSGHEIWHYDIKYLSETACIFNKYTFPGILEIVEFYTENRLGGIYLEKPVSLNDNHMNLIRVRMLKNICAVFTGKTCCI